MRRLKKSAETDLQLYVEHIMKGVKNDIKDAEWEIAIAAWAEYQSTDAHTENEKAAYGLCDEFEATDQDFEAISSQILRLLTNFKDQANKASASKRGL